MIDRATHGADGRPLIAHVVVGFDYGGLENGVVNVVNHLPDSRFRHAIVALTRASDFRSRIRRADVDVHELHKKPGKDPSLYLKLFRLFRDIRPAIVHTRNLGTLEASFVARLAGVPTRIHGEHGWDSYDPEGRSRKYRSLRRVLAPGVTRFVTVSSELECWLTETVGVPRHKVERICNGVNTRRFAPVGESAAAGKRKQTVARALLPADRFPPDSLVIGSITRFSEIKDPLNLVKAFITARSAVPGVNLRLLIAGDGPLRNEAQQLLEREGAAGFAWLPGSRDDVPELLRAMDVFVLGSRREGISNTVLEAMSTGLPVVATATGGNLELIEEGVSGRLVPVGESSAIARALIVYAASPSLRVAHGGAGRARIEREYSLAGMIAKYEMLYGRYAREFGEAA